MRLDRTLGALDPSSVQDRATLGGFGFSEFAFLGEDYDVLELDDVLELCNVDRRTSFRN